MHTAHAGLVAHTLQLSTLNFEAKNSKKTVQESSHERRHKVRSTRFYKQLKTYLLRNRINAYAKNIYCTGSPPVRRLAAAAAVNLCSLREFVSISDSMGDDNDVDGGSNSYPASATRNIKK